MLGYAGNMNRNHDVGKLSVAEACGIVLACLAVVILAASCRKTDETSISDEGKAKPPCAETRVEVKNAQIEAEMSQDARYKAEFERLVASSNMTVVATERQTSALCDEISRLPDKEYALRLYDRFLDLAIAQKVTETNLYFRAVWYEQLFYVGSETFYRGQSMKKESLERWNRFFRFLEKYTDEIVSVEKTIQKDGSRYLNLASFRSDMEKRDYLFKFRGRLEVEIRRFRKCTFPSLSEGLTEGQKADILRRFEEIETFTVMPQIKELGLPIQSTTNTPVNASGDGATKGSE